MSIEKHKTAADSSRRALAGSGVQSSIVRVGDEHSGFEMSVDSSRRLLRIRMWGLWDESTGEQFRNSALGLGATFKGASWSMFADARNFVAQSAAVTEYRKQVMLRSVAMGCKKIAAVVTQAAHGMQFKRIANESQVGSATFQDEASAMAWLFGDSGKVAVPDTRNKPLPSEPLDHRRNRR